jgi:hypothetical protein
LSQQKGFLPHNILYTLCGFSAWLCRLLIQRVMMMVVVLQVHVPEGLTGLDLDVIKLSAQFVARNGASFLTGLTTREANNPQVC